MAALPESVFGLAEVQFGAIEVAQLRDAGVSDHRRRRMTKRGDLVRVGSQSLRFAGTPQSFEQRCQCALFDAGPGAVLSHRTAAALWKFDGFSRSIVEVLVARTDSPDVQGALVHRTRLLPATDRSVVGTLEVTTATRTVIDLATCCGKSELEQAIDSSIRDGLTTETRLHARLQEMRGPGRSGIRLLDSVLDARPEGRVESVLERAFLGLLRDAGISTARSQATVHVQARRFRVDVLVADVVFEVSGHRTHSTRTQRRSDASRTRLLQLAGLRVFEFTADEVFGAPENVVLQLRLIAFELDLPRLISGG